MKLNQQSADQQADLEILEQILQENLPALQSQLRMLGEQRDTNQEEMAKMISERFQKVEQKLEESKKKRSEKEKEVIKKIQEVNRRLDAKVEGER